VEDDEGLRDRTGRRVRRSSIHRAKLKRPSRPFADFSVAEEVLAAWRPIHRTVQFALAIVAASDARMRAASTWPGERPDELRVTPGLIFAAEGGVSIHVLHRRRPSEAFGNREVYFDSLRRRTDFRLLGYAVVAKDGDWRTWHRTTFRMAELLEEFAAAFVNAKGRTAEARARAAGRALSGRSSSQYRRWERSLDDRFGDADGLWAFLGVPC
jgi:hypothetical protein